MHTTWRCPAGIAGCFLLAVLALSLAEWRGRAGRMFASTPKVAVRESRAEALDVWNTSRVHGRVLVHFDRQIAMSDVGGAPASESVLYRAVQSNVIRRVHHVVSDAAWPEVRMRLEGYPASSVRDDSIRITMEGTPIVISRPRDLAPLDEPVLVTIRGDDWSADEARAIIEKLHGGALRSDLVVAYGTGAAEIAAGIEGSR